MTIITRHFVAVGNRRVHYRRAGEGPPLVLLHGSPANSEVMLGEIAELSRHFTCFAPDTPGFGCSDPLPGDTLTVADLAAATAEVIEALGLTGTRLLGTHTGAAIGLELGALRPDLLGGLVLDAVPAFTNAEANALFEGYFAPLVCDPLGGHLTATWMRFRDQFTWFPWLSRDPKRLNPINRPEPEDIQLWVRMFYRACGHYKPAYRAACFYCEGAIDAAERLTLPAIFIATADDMLFRHLDRLPPMKAGQSIVKLPSGFSAKPAAIIKALLGLPGLDTVPPIAENTFAGTAPALGFIDAPSGQMFVRAYGAPTSPPLIILHDTPGSGLTCGALARELSDRYLVLVPDLPGCGESGFDGDEVAGLGADAVAAAADAVSEMVVALGIERYAMLGRGVGSIVAAVLAQRGAQMTALLLDGVMLPHVDTATRIAPDLPLDPTGAHWIKAWLMVRDGETYAPWYDGQIAAQRHVAVDLDASSLHDRTFEIMKARSTYFRLPRDACNHDPFAALAQCAAPIILFDRNDSAHVAGSPTVAAQLPSARLVAVVDEAEMAASVASLLS